LGATGATKSNFIGQSAGSGATIASNSNFMGDSAGLGATSASRSNFFGQNAGFGASGASNSNFFGYQTGSGATGSNNIIIGTNISLTGSNSINIGGVLFGTGTYNTTTGSPLLNAQTNGKIGIGIVEPEETLHVSGNTRISDGLTATTISGTTTLSTLLNLTIGTVPTSPNDGDIWLESNDLTGLKIRISGVTRTINIT
jgi:hypothetical protein